MRKKKKNKEEKKIIKPEILELTAKAQKQDALKYHIYKYLERKIPDKRTKGLLNKLAEEKLNNYKVWVQFAGELESEGWEEKMYLTAYKLFGLTLCIKLMERNNPLRNAQYPDLKKELPGFDVIEKNEKEHEKTLEQICSKKEISFISNRIIGLNLILFTTFAALWTSYFAFAQNRICGIIGIITTIFVFIADFCATFLVKNFGNQKARQLKNSLVRYLIGLAGGLSLAIPFFVFKNPVTSSILSGIWCVLLSVAFNTYVAIINDQPVVRKTLRIVTAFLAIILLAFGLSHLANTLI